MGPPREPVTVQQMEIISTHQLTHNIVYWHGVWGSERGCDIGNETAATNLSYSSIATPPTFHLGYYLDTQQ